MRRNSFWERLFPVRYDFYAMLTDQANATTDVIKGLLCWLNTRTDEDCKRLLDLVKESDKSRFGMEEKLIEAFVTPFDRQDIYSISVEMSRIVQYVQSTQKEIEIFGVLTTSKITTMVQQLSAGTDQLSNAIGLLKNDPHKSQSQIGSIRKVQKTIENEYRSALVELFNSNNLNSGLKYREVYHHIKDSAAYLGYTTDILHRIIVRLI